MCLFCFNPLTLRLAFINDYKSFLWCWYKLNSKLLNSYVECFLNRSIILLFRDFSAACLAHLTPFYHFNSKITPFQRTLKFTPTFLSKLLNIPLLVHAVKFPEWVSLTPDNHIDFQPTQGSNYITGRQTKNRLQWNFADNRRIYD